MMRPGFWMGVLCVWTLASCVAEESVRETAHVLRVVDGDTIVVKLAGREERVRLLRVDTPESVHPDRKQNIPAGQAASEFTAQHLAHKDVQLEREFEDRDGHGRLLRYVWLEGTNFCVTLVQAGHAPYYTPYGHGSYRRLFEQAEQEARAVGRGIWGDPDLSQKYLRLKSKWGEDAQRADARAASSLPAPEPNPQTPAKAEPFVASAQSKVYHRAGCTYVARITPQNRLTFETSQAAQESSRQPCKECQP